MKHFLSYIIILCTTLCFVACGSDDENVTPEPDPVVTHYKRTVIAYVTGDNNISSNLSTDVNEMLTGSKSLSSDCKLIVYADLKDQKPYIAEITNGTKTIVKQYTDDFSSVNPDSMLSIMQWIVDQYPADEYGTIIEGHGSGSIITLDTVANKLFTLNAYGYDNTTYNPSNGNSLWMNIPSMAKVFSKLPHQKFIFFDCCCMGNVETAYELRNSADYIIAPVCETPAAGAPYSKVVPLLADDATSIGKEIIDAYIANTNFGDACGLCMTDIQTSNLEALKDATKLLLQKMYSKQDTSEVSTLTVPITNAIYYYKDAQTSGYQVLQDMKSMFRNAIDNELLTQSEFDTWKAVLEKTVIYKSMPEKNGEKPLWITSTDMYPNINFYAFLDYFDEEHYGALSMIFPNANYNHSIIGGYPSVNETMFRLEWCNAVGWHEFGW